MNKKNDRGFTLIETISIMTLIGIVAVYLGFGYSTPNTELIIQSELLKGHLRFSQSKAMAADVPWGVRFDTASNIYYLRENGSDSSQFFPNEQSNSVNLNALGITISVSGGPLEITFSPYRGIPNAGYTITLTKDSQTKIITVTPNTGFIS